jgi:hypothetical protein
MQVVVSIPPSHAGERFPVLIALHGRGEMLKGPERGARGWIDDYGLYRALERIRRPPLRGDDLRGLYDSPALGRLNHALNLRPYRGLIIVSPYTPELFSGDSAFEAAGSFADFLVGEVLERVYRETPAMGRAETTGIDGVSLGGRAALLVGFHRPKAFAVVSSLQAAFDVDDAPELAVRSRRARAENPKLLIRLLTSEGDYFLQANLAISAALKRAGVEHELLVVPGPHDYEFNRGPGVFEMLAFHDRTLRQTSSQIRASVPDAGAKP